MSASDVIAVVAATLLTVLIAVLATLLVLLVRTLRELRETVDVLRDDAIDLLDETSVAVGDAAVEIDRVERLVTSAERMDELKRSLATPMVKAMAFGTGVSRATKRLRAGEPSPRRRTKRKRAS
jgi:HAMP domain-containing protein